MEALLERLTEKGKLKMKTRNQIYLIVALFLALAIAWNVCGVNAEVKESQSVEIQTSEQTGPDKSAAHWLERAETSAINGNSAHMEAYFTRAKWCVEDIDIFGEVKTAMLKNISERAEAIRPSGYREAASDELVNALACAYGCFEPSMRSSLERFKFYCLKAGMDPDGKVEKVREILAASLAERKELENRL